MLIYICYRYVCCVAKGNINGQGNSSVLNANKECSKATLQVSAKGLAFVEFNIDDFVAKYYLVSQQTS